jgi:hypothetical protein
MGRPSTYTQETADHMEAVRLGKLANIAVDTTIDIERGRVWRITVSYGTEKMVVDIAADCSKEQVAFALRSLADVVE